MKEKESPFTLSVNLAYDKEKPLVFDLNTANVSFAILGEDPRQSALSDLLQEQGFPILPKEEATVLLLPYMARNYLPEDTLRGAPNTKLLIGGGLSPSFLSKAASYDILCLDYLQDEELIWQNTIATTEGVLAEAISRSKGNLTRSHCLVIGYGHCGQTLVSYLEKFFCRITVCEESLPKRANASLHADVCSSLGEIIDSLPGISYVFNTAPGFVIPPEYLALWSKDTCILDLASSLPQTTTHLPALPGIYAPKASARLMLNFILHQCLEHL